MQEFGLELISSGLSLSKVTGTCINYIWVQWVIKKNDHNQIKGSVLNMPDHIQISPIGT